MTENRPASTAPSPFPDHAVPGSDGAYPPHVYVHVPFCARRCSYCDFSIAVRREVPVVEYLAALERELELRHPRRREGWRVSTLYFGGGTPSLLGPRGVQRLVRLFREWMELEADAEITLEANPEDTSAVAAAIWRDAGINRVSLGAQSFSPDALEWMHRIHDAERIADAVRAVREVGLSNFSLDLIFGLPPHVRRDWRADLESALALEPPHISLYGLAIESGAPLRRRRDRGEVVEGDEEGYETEFLLAAELLAGEGFSHYEVSNYARPGRQSRHNASYWTGAPYTGLGPSAHGYDGTRRRWNLTGWVAWRDALAAGEDPGAGEEMLDEENRLAERVYLGLRTHTGLPLDEAERAHVAPWVAAGWGSLDRDGRLRLTPSGWLRLDALAAALTALRSHC